MRAFFDSNIAVYSVYDDKDPRCEVAQRVLDQHDAAGQAVMSTQVLLETYNVLVNKKRAAPQDAARIVHLLTRYEIAAPSERAALAATELAAQHRISIWDAFIVQAALEAGCTTLFSEDMQAGRRFGPLTVVNPFEVSAHEAAPVYGAQAKQASNPAAPRAKTSPRKPAALAAPSKRRRG